MDFADIDPDRVQRLDEAALRGMTIPPSFGTQPNYWDRYRLYKDVVRKFGASPSLTTCLQ